MFLLGQRERMHRGNAGTCIVTTRAQASWRRVGMHCGDACPCIVATRANALWQRVCMHCGNACACWRWQREYAVDDGKAEAVQVKTGTVKVRAGAVQVDQLGQMRVDNARACACIVATQARARADDGSARIQSMMARPVPCK